jgi:hypothetical protein
VLGWRLPHQPFVRVDGVADAAAIEADRDEEQGPDAREPHEIVAKRNAELTEKVFRGSSHTGC